MLVRLVALLLDGDDVVRCLENFLLQALFLPQSLRVLLFEAGVFICQCSNVDLLFVNVGLLLVFSRIVGGFQLIELLLEVGLLLPDVRMSL